MVLDFWLVLRCFSGVWQWCRYLSHRHYPAPADQCQLVCPLRGSGRPVCSSGLLPTAVWCQLPLHDRYNPRWRLLQNQLHVDVLLKHQSLRHDSGSLHRYCTSFEVHGLDDKRSYLEPYRHSMGRAIPSLLLSRHLYLSRKPVVHHVCRDLPCGNLPGFPVASLCQRYMPSASLGPQTCSRNEGFGRPGSFQPHLWRSEHPCLSSGTAEYK